MYVCLCVYVSIDLLMCERMVCACVSVRACMSAWAIECAYMRMHPRVYVDIYVYINLTHTHINIYTLTPNAHK